MLKYWIGFNKVPGIGSKRLRALIHAFGDVEAAWHADEKDLAAVGLDQRSLKNLLSARRTLDLDAELARLEETDIQVLTWDDPEYPANLKRIESPPPVLYVRGALSLEDEWAVAVVGTRRATSYDQEVTRKITAGLVQAGTTIVSGLARGVDAIAHQTALEMGGRTLAVLGHGLDRIYPPEHRQLAQKIVQQGALISEQPLGTRPESRNFPARNRIISGLSLAVLVVACPWNSGAIITAKHGLEQGREVFAVPGGILSRNSEGPNRLIKEGATLVTSANDILDALNLSQAAQYVDARLTLPEDPQEAHLLQFLSSEPRHVDVLGREAQMPVSQVSSLLAMMELKGLVRSVGGMKYVLARDL